MFAPSATPNVLCTGVLVLQVVNLSFPSLLMLLAMSRANSLSIETIKISISLICKILNDFD